MLCFFNTNNGDIMREIDLSKYKIRTDLVADIISNEKLSNIYEENDDINGCHIKRIRLDKDNALKIDKKDIIYYAALIVTISAIAYIVNELCDSNLMFISQNYPGTFIEVIYNLSGKLFPLVMVAAQAVLPFYFIYEIYTSILDKKENKSNLKDTDKSEDKKEVYMN